MTEARLPELDEHHPLRRLPVWLKRMLNACYWRVYDFGDAFAEAVGWLPSHILRLACYRYLLRIRIGGRTSVHCRCRVYCPPGVSIGSHSVINREVLLDGRSGLTIGSNVSISEGVALVTLGHDPQSATFGNRGAPIMVEDRVFVGMRAMVLPGVTLGEGCFVGAGAVVTRDVPPYTIVAGVPARSIGGRQR
ncbi:MAG: acyltransferase, partial [Anaerolineae bacterium]